jgi:hypothetical protein
MILNPITYGLGPRKNDYCDASDTYSQFIVLAIDQIHRFSIDSKAPWYYVGEPFTKAQVTVALVYWTN